MNKCVEIRSSEATAVEPGSDQAQANAHSISRRGLLKKAVYVTPSIVVLGTLGSIRTGVAASLDCDGIPPDHPLCAPPPPTGRPTG